MKFDAIVGNPPYQEDKDNNNRKAPIYHLFYDISFKLSKIVSLITPARFLFNAGQTPQKWNEKMLNDEHIKVIQFYPNSKEVFDSVDIKGGIVTLLRDENENFGKIGIFTTNNLVASILNKILNNGSFVPFSSIIYSKSACGFTENLYKDFPQYKSRLTKGNEYIIDANIFEKIPEIFYDKCVSNDCIKVFGRLNNHRIYKFIDSKYIKKSPNLNAYKVFITGVNGTGKMGECLSDLTIGEPNTAYTQTFMSIGRFLYKEEAINCEKYIKTKFLRLLLGTLKVTQNNSKETWANIPLQEFSDKSDIDWSKSIPEIDQKLYKKYNLTEEEINFIESKIKPME